MLNCLDDILRTGGKSARLCQKTGNGKRNISACGIVGDGIYDLCMYQRTSWKDHLSRQIQSRSQDQLDIRIRSICGNIDTG